MAFQCFQLIFYGTSLLKCGAFLRKDKFWLTKAFCRWRVSTLMMKHPFSQIVSATNVILSRFSLKDIDVSHVRIKLALMLQSERRGYKGKPRVF